MALSGTVGEAGGKISDCRSGSPEGPTGAAQFGTTIDQLRHPEPRPARFASDRGRNVGNIERVASVAAGGILAASSAREGGLRGAGMALLGGMLAYRGITGRCACYRALGVSTAGPGSKCASVDASRALLIRQSVTINRPAEELYRFWRGFGRFPRFFEILESVVVLDDKRSHWLAKAPAGQTIGWEAEIIREEEGRLIAWRSLPNSQIAHAGTVRFLPAPGGRGTEVRMEIDCEPPAGRVGNAFAKLFQSEPEGLLERALHRFKQLMETGESPTTKGQTSGRSPEAFAPKRNGRRR